MRISHIFTETKGISRYDVKSGQKIYTVFSFGHRQK